MQPVEKAVTIAAVDVTKHLRGAANLSSTTKDRQQFANAAGDCIHKQSSGEFNGKLREKFEHPVIIALGRNTE